MLFPAKKKTSVAQKHRVISRQEKIAFTTPVELSLDSPPLPQSLYGRVGGRAYVVVTTKFSQIDRVSNLRSNGAPLAGFAHGLCHQHYSPL